MHLENGRISHSQLVFLVTGFLMGSSVILFPGGGAENNAWLATLAGLAEGFIFLAIYLTLATRFPGYTLIGINDLVFGSYLGKIISVCYLLFFLFVGAQVVRSFGEFFAVIMTATPMQVFVVLMLVICASAVRNGIEVITRCSQILVPFSITVLLFNFLLIWNKAEFSNLLPFMDIPVKQFILASQSTAALPFGETVVFLSILAFVSHQSQVWKPMSKAFIIAGLVLIMVDIRTVTVLGSFAELATYPSFTVVRYINLADILTRLDVAVAANFLGMGFLKVTILYYAAVTSTAEMLKVRSYVPLVLPIGALMYSLNTLLYDSYVFDIIDATALFPIYSPIFTLILPLLTLIFSPLGIKRFKKQEEYDNAC